MVLSLQQWFGKVAVVTGASSGIGHAIAGKLVVEGLQVVGLARRVELINALSEKLRDAPGKLFPIKADVTREDDTLKAFQWIKEHFGKISILVNSAGIFRDDSLIFGSSEQWKSVIDTNVLALCLTTREAIKIMQENQINGHIIHINSYCGHRIPPSPNLSIYAASKAAVTALTETLRQELLAQKSKIKITSISPGMVETEMTTLNKNCSADKIEMFKSMPSLQSDDIADALVYALATPPHVQIHELIIKPVGEIF